MNKLHVKVKFGIANYKHPVFLRKVNNISLNPIKHWIKKHIYKSNKNTDLTASFLNIIYDTDSE